MRNGRLLHTLQAAACTSDPDPENSAQHVLQAEELPDSRLLRPQAARAGPTARSSPTGEEDPPGLREDTNRRTPAALRRAQSLQHLRYQLQTHLQREARRKVSSMRR